MIRQGDGLGGGDGFGSGQRDIVGEANTADGENDAVANTRKHGINIAWAGRSSKLAVLVSNGSVRYHDSMRRIQKLVSMAVALALALLIARAEAPFSPTDAALFLDFPRTEPAIFGLYIAG